MKKLILSCIWACLAIGVHAADWIDVTNVFIQNPRFDNNSNEGWIWQSDAWSQTVRVECMEFWNGTFNIWQDLSGLPQGKYRLSVQAFYRTGDNNQGYEAYTNGSENIPAYLYASDTKQKLVSVYSYELSDYTDGCWTYGNSWWGDVHYFPNTMESASVAFGEGGYWNSMEFNAEGDIRIGLYNDVNNNNNWCIFDNFKLEYYGNAVKVTKVEVSIANNQLVIGESSQCTTTVTPANALQKTVTWSSSNTNVATVDENGLVTALAKGYATIKATSTDGSNKSGSVTITVSENTVTAAQLVVNEIMASNVDEYISPAFNFDGWIELYNPTDKDVVLGGLYLSDEAQNLTKWHMPTTMGTIPAKGFFTLWFDSQDIAPLNAPFKLDVDGGTLYFSNASGELITSQAYPASKERISYARTTDGGSTWGLTATPTPGASNATSTFASVQLAAPVVDQPSQMFDGSLVVNVTIPSGCTLRYTTDGTLPTLTNGKVSQTGMFTVSYTQSYRFRLFANGKLPSPVTTRSYIFKDRDYYLPVVSVVTDPDFLYSSEIGVMMEGPNGRPGNGKSYKCNWNMNWERPVNFSYLDADGEMVLNQDVNLEMCGGWSRAWTPHSFKLKGSKEMGGDKNLPYPFFTQKPYIRNRTLQIRNGGNDNNCRFKDPSMAYLVQTSGIDVDVQAYEPVHEFINGEYIGVLNVREPNNKHYVYANYGWDDDEIDQWEMSPDSGYVQKCGSPEVYNNLCDVLSPDAANPETYQEICQLLDIDEFVNYMAIQFYYGGSDWPRNNVKCFRYRDGGKFRFVLFDVDAAFDYGSNVFNEFMYKETWTFDQLYPTSLGRITDQIRMVTLFKNLLQNANFRRKFIDTYSMVGGSVFEVSRVQTILDELYNRVEPAMQLEGRSAYSTYNTVRTKLSSRLSTATQALKNFGSFNLSSVNAQSVTLQSDAEGAQIMVNGQVVPTGVFKGNMFAPVSLKALAPAGYQFQGWIKGSGGNATTLKQMGTSWSYYDQGSLDNTNWTSPSYNTNNWKNGNAPLGYSNKDGIINTQLDYGGNSSNKRPTYYFRTTINLQNAPTATDEFSMDYYIDDGLVVYVNGTEAARFNMPSGNISYNTYASSYADDFPTGTLTLNANLFHKGNNVIAVEVHNNSANSTDIIFDAAINAVLASTGTPEYYSTEQEINLPSGTVNLTASYRALSTQERQQQGINPVRINEVSGSNSSYINEYFKKNDWVELYNTTDSEIDVNGMYLTDDAKNPTKYQIAKNGTKVNTKIPAHGYLLIWCDKLATTDQALHASFKISGDGGMLALTAADKSWTDAFYYGAHDGTTTVGRYPDGGADIYVMHTPTISKANIYTSYAELTDQEALKEATPVAPVFASANGYRICYGSQQLYLKGEEGTDVLVEIYGTDGRLVERTTVLLGNGTTLINVSHLPSGFYVARATIDRTTRVACKFMK